MDAKSLLLSDGVKFFVYDFDAIGKDEELGMVVLAPKLLYNSTGERLELKLQPMPGSEKEVPGFLGIRCRRATEYDKHFMFEFKRAEGKGDVFGLKSLEQKTDSKGGNGALQSILTRKTRIAKQGRNIGMKEVREQIV